MTVLSEEDFEDLPDKLKLAYLLGVAAELLGPDLAKRVYQANRPLVDDLVGHGPVWGERPDPSENYWGGVWRVWEAE